MELSNLWFILIGVLFIGFFFLEGFDYGAMILMPFLGRSDKERRLIINTIGPVWDGNEVWLLTAGGAIFAAFPNWYATLFSGFYLALFLILLALISRSVAFEFRSKIATVKWRKTWDWVLFGGSLLPALLWGVAFANLVKGVPIDANMEFTGNFFSLLSIYTLTAGLFSLAFFTYHGALYLLLKTSDQLVSRTSDAAKKIGIVAIILWVILLGETVFVTDGVKLVVVITLIVTTGLVLLSYVMVAGKRYGWAFISNGTAIVFAVASLFAGMFPNVMKSTTDAVYSLTVQNASSSPYTLKVMTIVALTMVPIVLAYQIWTYWVFRKRVTQKDVEY